MVANVRCEDIKNDQLAAFTGDQAWQALQEQAAGGVVPDFGARAAGLKDSCIDGYDQEAMYFHAGVREAKRAELLEGLAAALAGPFDTQTRHISDLRMAEFDKAFRLGLSEGRGGGFSACARACEADALAQFDGAVKGALIPGVPELNGAAAREALARRIGDYVDKARHAKVKEAAAAAEKRMASLLTPTAVDLLQDCPPGLWPKLHAAKASALAAANGTLQSALGGVDLSDSERKAAAAKLEAASQAKLSSLLQEAVLTRVSRMRDAFNAAFTLDENKTPRTWMPRDNIDQLARAARRAAANTLAALCVVRGPDYAGGDGVERAVLAMAAPDIDPAATGAAAGEGGGGGGYDIASASEWPGEVPRDEVLVTPAEARSAWREFMSASTLAVQQAKITQQANLAAGRRAPPLWAVFAIMLLGWNEFVAVIWNPIYMVLGFLLFMFGWMMYAELDVDARMQQGWLAGAFGIWSHLGEALQTVSHRAYNTSTALLGEGANMLQERVATQQQQQQLAQGSTQWQGEGVSSGPQHHRSTQGLVRRKQEATDGVQLVHLAGGAGAAAMAVPGPKDE